MTQLRGLGFLLFIATIGEATGLANEKLLTLRARDRHVRLVNADMRFSAARMKGLAARLAHQRLFAKTAFHHGCNFSWHRKIDPCRTRTTARLSPGAKQRKTKRARKPLSAIFSINSADLIFRTAPCC